MLASVACADRFLGREYLASWADLVWTGRYGSVLLSRCIFNKIELSE